jgi:N-methylhydantoinase A/oxoprolinase/acetone carboxylase beta subunit
MRGAAFLSKSLDIIGIENSIVVDIGGTSTDVGQLVKGFPREAAARVEVVDNFGSFGIPSPGVDFIKQFYA